MSWLLLFLGSFSIVLEAVAVKFLWTWFIVPLGVVEISLIHALGISILFSLLTKEISTKKKTTDENLEMVIAILTRLGLALIIGWSASNFM